jgi:hypothetical protein
MYTNLAAVSGMSYLLWVVMSLTVRVALGWTGDDNTRSRPRNSTARGADVAQELAKGNRALGGDEGVNRPLQDLALSPDAGAIRPTKDGLEHKSAQKQKRREGMHGGLNKSETAQASAVLMVNIQAIVVDDLDLHGDHIYFFDYPGQYAKIPKMLP